jgi:hypothetical protein
MNRTEERLGDALRASAAQVRDDRLRPLPEFEPGTRQPRRARAAHWGWLPGAWRSWLGPAAAAVSVALVIGLVLTLTNAVGRAPASPSGVAAPLPKYFARFPAKNADDGSVEIRSVATGAVAAAAPSPHRAGWSLRGAALAAAPDGRTFYVAYTAQPSAGSPLPQTWIYRFSTASSGLTMIKGGMIPADVVISRDSALAISPDGGKLALTVAAPDRGVGYPGPGLGGKIIVIDLRTGARTTWAGGLGLSGHTMLIADVSWTTDERSIVFLVLWCKTNVDLGVCEDALDQITSRAAQVRSVPLASHGGLLSRGPGLLTPGGTVPVIAAAVAGPRPDELTVVLLSGRKTVAGPWPDVIVERVVARSGSVLDVEYRQVAKSGRHLTSVIQLAADPGGQHLLLTYASTGGFRTGWIGQGQFHPLPVREPYLTFPITAW